VALVPDILASTKHIRSNLHAAGTCAHWRIRHEQPEPVLHDEQERGGVTSREKLSQLVAASPRIVARSCRVTRRPAGSSRAG
jgi:hypothetical protein